MARSKKSETTGKPQAPLIKVGDRIILVEDGPRNGQHDAVVEIDLKNGIYRGAVFGWLRRKQFEVLDEPIAPAPQNGKPDAAAVAAAKTDAEHPPNEKLRTNVDGAPADVVLDGKSGGLVEPLVKPALEDLVKSLATAKLRLEKAATVKKRATEDYNDAHGTYIAIADEIVEQYGNVEQLALDLSMTETENDEEEPEPVGAGTE